MKARLPLLLIFLCSQIVSAQQWLSSSSFYAVTNIGILNSVVDKNENHFVTGFYNGNMTTSLGTLTSNGADIFLGRYDKNDVLQWMNRVTGAGVNHYSDVAFDNNYLYLIGSYNNSADFADGSPLATTGNYDVFLAKYNKNGGLIWKKNIAKNPALQLSQCISIDDSSNLLVAINYVDSININNKRYNGRATKYCNVIAKIDSAGNIKNVINLVSSGNTYIKSIAVYDDGYYFNGYFLDTVYFDVKTIVDKTTFTKCFLYKTNYSLNGQWVRRTYGNANDQTGTLASDDYGNVYYCGFYNSNAGTFYADSTSTLPSPNHLTNNGNSDIFILKYNRNGTLQWSRGYGQQGKEWARGLFYKNDILYLTGYFTDTIIFGEDILTSANINDQDFFFGTFDIEYGTMLKAVGITEMGTAGNESGTAIAVHDNMNAHVSAYFKTDSIQVGTQRHKKMGNDVFVATYRPSFISQIQIASPITCNGNTDGVLEVNGFFGVLPYSYEWSHSSTLTGNMAYDLGPGSYSVTVTDARDSVAVATLLLNEPAMLALSSQLTHAKCYETTSGAINLTVSGGTAPYIYAWEGPAGTNTTSEDQVNVGGGTFKVTVTDNGECQAITTMVLTRPSPLSLAGTAITHVNPAGAANGVINLNVSGGTPSYSYLWNGGQTTQDRSALSGGIYAVTATDINLCSIDTNLVVNDTGVFIVYIVSKKDVVCKGESNGEATAAVLNGKGTITYLWKNSGGITVDNDNVANNLAADVYYVTATDSYDGDTYSTSVVINEAATALNIAINPNDISCYGKVDGYVSVMMSGGVLPYSFLWSNGATTEDISNIPAGNYILTVTDKNGCVDIDNATVDAPAAINVNITVDQPLLCYGNTNGILTANASGGIGSLEYLWNDPAHQEAATATGLSAGNYSVSVSDANGCKTIRTTNLAQPDDIVIQPTSSDVHCAGGNDGIITLSVTGGTPTIDYIWKKDGLLYAITKNISGLTAATYTVVATDVNNCTEYDTVIITEPTALSISASLTTQVQCNGNSDGAVAITVTGGTLPYSYLWSNSATSAAISGLAAAGYDVTVTDFNSCSLTGNYTLTEPSSLSLTLTGITHIPCKGQTTGVIDITVAGGTAAYYYIWSNGTTTEDQALMAAGLYSVTVVDGNNCMVTGSYAITEITALKIDTLQISELLCYGDTTGITHVVVSGGTAPYHYLWSNGDTTQIITGLGAGIYSITVTDMNLCSNDSSFNLSEPSQIIISGSLISHVLCHGGNTGAADIAVSGGNAPYSFLWSISDTTEDISSLPADTFMVTITDAVLCRTTGSIIITEPTALSIDAALSHISLGGGSTGAINITVSGGTAGYSFIWSNLATTEDLDTLVAGNYFVTISDANNCELTDAFYITDPASVIVADTITHVLCNGSITGAIDLTVSGGSSPYTFAWSSGATDEDILNLSAGSYTVTVADAVLKTFIGIYMVTQPDTISVLANSIPVTCPGGNNGAIDITVSGGLPGYDFLWSNGITNEDISGLAAGNASITVTDTLGCILINTIVVTEPSVLGVDSLTVVDASTGTSTDGSIKIKAQGGTTPYRYVLVIDTSYTGLFDTLAKGNYTIRILDTNGCTFDTTITINSNIEELAVPSRSVVLYPNPSQGMITLHITGPVAEQIQIVITNSKGQNVYSRKVGILSVHTETIDLSGNPAGIYLVEIRGVHFRKLESVIIE